MKKTPTQKLFDKAWKLCSEYIRRRDFGVCFTCKKKQDYKTMHTGHFRHGKHTPIYFNEYNLHCQCVSCNLYHSGNRDIYLRNIQKKYGIKKGDWLIRESYKVHKYTPAELERIIKKYTKLLAGLDK